MAAPTGMCFKKTVIRDQAKLLSSAPTQDTKFWKSFTVRQKMANHSTHYCQTQIDYNIVILD